MYRGAISHRPEATRLDLSRLVRFKTQWHLPVNHHVLYIQSLYRKLACRIFCARSCIFPPDPASGAQSHVCVIR